MCCGLYAGPAGAVACTGEGEEIIKQRDGALGLRAHGEGRTREARRRAEVAEFPASSTSA
jgi:isoaspartyl peptidase/L-asparaginase-like protein (Ntn-hydrolase superfamily)